MYCVHEHILIPFFRVNYAIFGRKKIFPDTYNNSFCVSKEQTAVDKTN